MKTSGPTIKLFNYQPKSKAAPPTTPSLAKDGAEELKKDPPKLTENKDPSPKNPTNSSRVNVSETAKQLAKSLVDGARVLPKPVPGGLPAPQIRAKTKAENLQKVEKLKAERLVDKPGVFVLGSLSPLGLNLISDGLEDIAQGIPEATYHDYDDVEQIIAAIKKREKAQPIILVGHGLGGDSAVEIAQKLNSVEHGFRKIDLLVTLDSQGKDNDLIPQNVVKNLNYIGKEQGWLNDEPNMPMDMKRTTVINNLREEGHLSLDNSEAVQMEIVENINNLIIS